MATKTSIGLPKITISMIQQTWEASTRSERGIVVLILRESTDGTSGEYSYVTRGGLTADKALWSDENYQYIRDALLAGPNRVYVLAIGAEDDLTDLLNVLNLKAYRGRLVMPDATTEESQEIVDWVVVQESEENSWHALVCGVDNPDCRHVEALSTAQIATIQWVDSTREDSTPAQFLPRLGGILSACNVKRSATSYELEDVSGWTTPDGTAWTDAQIASEIDAGKLCLYNDRGSITIARGINSLQTIDEGENTNDMCFVDIVETVDMVRDDIRALFRTHYLGKKKNSADNQALFVGRVNDYIEDLKAEEVLEVGDDYKANIDVDAMRTAWKNAGRDVDDLTDAEIKAMTYERQVMISMYIKPLRAMEDLTVAGTLE